MGEVQLTTNLWHIVALCRIMPETEELKQYVSEEITKIINIDQWLRTRLGTKNAIFTELEHGNRAEIIKNNLANFRQTCRTLFQEQVENRHY